MLSSTSSKQSFQEQTYSFKFLQRSRQRGGGFERSRASDIALNGDRLVKGLGFFGSALRVPLLLFSLLRVWKDWLLAGYCCTGFYFKLYTCSGQSRLFDEWRVALLTRACFPSTLTVYIMCINVFQKKLSSRELLLLLQNITVERSPRPTFGRGDRIVIVIILFNNIFLKFIFNNNISK